MLKDKEIEVSSNLDLNYLEELAQKEPIKKIFKETKKENSPIIDDHIINQSTLSQLNRIESKQNAILEILDTMPKLSTEIIMEDINRDDEDILKLNLELFCARFVILSTKANNKNIEELLLNLQNISQHLFSNSFHIFSNKKSPVQTALTKIILIGMGDSILNHYLNKTEELLKQIDSFAKISIFEQHYNFANLLLDKGLLLNSITLFNELTGVYIIESIKTYSKNINKSIYILGEENSSKLHSQAKEFVDTLFMKDVIIPLFPNHKVPKDIDREIARKLQNINRTWSNRGDENLFKRYIYISNRIRVIRNSVAHANMEISFKDINNQLKELASDFYYLAIQKNIFKK